MFLVVALPRERPRRLNGECSHGTARRENICVLPPVCVLVRVWTEGRQEPRAHRRHCYHSCGADGGVARWKVDGGGMVEVEIVAAAAPHLVLHVRIDHEASQPAGIRRGTGRA